MSAPCGEEVEVEDIASIQVQDSQRTSRRVVLAIGNIYEFNEKHNSELSVSRLIDKRLQKQNFAVSAEMALFWGGSIDQRIVVLPAAPDQAFVEHVSNRLGIEITCVVPECVTGWVCRDLLADQRTLQVLAEALGKLEVVVIPWGATDYLYQLIATLKAQGANIVEERYPPISRQRIGEYIDSKVGGRSILECVAADFPNFAVPHGYVCANRDEAALLACTLLHQDAQPLVLKSNRGAGGRGIRIVMSPSTLGLISHTPDSIKHDMRDDQYWKDVPVIVEAAIGGATDLSVPTFNGSIDSQGNIMGMPVGNSLVEAHQYYCGVELGRGVLPPDLYSHLEQIGVAVGQHLMTLGYRGWYDVDFLISSFNDVIYGSEINARLTGPAFAIDVMSRLFGSNWPERYYARVQERIWLKRPMRTYRELARVISSIEGYFAEDDCGILPVFTSGITLNEPYIGCVIYARSAQHADLLEAEIRRLLDERLSETVSTADNLPQVANLHGTE